MHRLNRLAAPLAFLFALVFARADEPSIIAKARAYIGSEDALNAVTSLHLSGAFTTLQAGVAGQSGLSMDIVIQKPAQYQVTVTSEVAANGRKFPVVQTVALDGYDGWRRVPNASGRPQLNLLTIDQIRGLRAEVWENIGFYRGIEVDGGRVEDQGVETIDGVSCEKIAFIHSASVVYYRYFDRDTGRLVYTKTAGGLEIREQGTSVVAGIKFPKKIVSIEPAKPGVQAKTTELTFNHIGVNEFFPPSRFAVPLPEIPPEPAAAPSQLAPAVASPAPVAVPQAAAAP